MAENTEIDLRDAVRCGSKRGGDTARGVEFGEMPLAVIEREGVAVEAVAAGERETGGGIESAANKADGFRSSGLAVDMPRL